MDTAAAQGRTKSCALLLGGSGFHSQCVHSSLGRTSIRSTEARPHAIPQISYWRWRVSLYSDHVVQNGNSSLLSFTVTDINSAVTKLMALGAELDGSIKYEIHGKVAAMRCIDGHMLGLYEPA
ncbi:hypothetical protein CICLE_v10022889mg [Citrus x clementina]|uniref:Uncharacterized protein n=1 Tax=Citrus clementina TaxID=85681 RepID=V4TH57_CITCL|nr:hypothetical protein CICLE_v10022889mg [Citrus x clementina]